MTASEIKIAVLKSEIAIGIKDLDRGNFQTYDDVNQLAEDICRCGRMRRKVVAKVQEEKVKCN